MTNTAFELLFNSRACQCSFLYNMNTMITIKCLENINFNFFSTSSARKFCLLAVFSVFGIANTGLVEIHGSLVWLFIASFFTCRAFPRMDKPTMISKYSPGSVRYVFHFCLVYSPPN